MDNYSLFELAGLNEKEARVYRTLLETGNASAYVIARRSGLKNPTTYVVLDQLIEKGMAEKIPRSGKTLYLATPPEKIFSRAEEKFEKAKKELSQLKALTKKNTSKINAFYFEGEKGVERALLYGIKECRGKELVGFYATARNITTRMKKVLREYTGKVIKDAGITMRGFAPDDATLSVFREIDKKEGRMFKTLSPDIYSSETSLDVIGNMVRIFDTTKDSLQAIIIENPQVAKMVREIFECAWERKF